MTVEELKRRSLGDGSGFTVEFQRLGSICVLSLLGGLHAGSVEVLESQFDRLWRTPCRRVVVDVSEVTGVDETGARVLAGLRYYVTARGGTLTVIGMSTSFRATLAAAEDFSR